MKTTVINIKNAPEGWQNDPQYVYIGRANPRRRLRRSKWANPYTIYKQTREQAIAHFRTDMEYECNFGIGTFGMREDLLRLAGKTLVCWCKPLACHGDVLAEMADRLASAPLAGLDGREG